MVGSRTRRRRPSTVESELLIFGRSPDDLVGD